MAKKKSTRKPQKKLKFKLDSTFNCLNCNQENSVSVKILKDANKATLSCKLCNISFSVPSINNLTAPVDVYHEWVDKFEKIQEKLTADREERQEQGPRRNIPQYQYQDEEDDEIVNDDEEIDILDQVVNEDAADVGRTMRNRVISESESEGE